MESEEPSALKKLPYAYPDMWKMSKLLSYGAVEIRVGILMAGMNIINDI